MFNWYTSLAAQMNWGTGHGLLNHVISICFTTESVWQYTNWKHQHYGLSNYTIYMSAMVAHIASQPKLPHKHSVTDIIWKLIANFSCKKPSDMCLYHNSMLQEYHITRQQTDGIQCNFIPRLTPCPKFVMMCSIHSVHTDMILFIENYSVYKISSKSGKTYWIVNI